MILLDFIEALPVDDPAQLHAREWAQRVRELQKRQDELIQRAEALLAADDLDAFDATLDEHEAALVEHLALCHKLMEFVSRLHRHSTETRH